MRNLPICRYIFLRKFFQNCKKKLQHAPFDYTINVRNTNSSERTATVRIFLCPVNDERGAQLSFEDQRKLMIEMDAFPYTFNPGVNNITRRSEESSVTLPYERALARIGSSYQIQDPELRSQFEFCGCGKVKLLNCEDSWN